MKYKLIILQLVLNSKDTQFEGKFKDVSVWILSFNFEDFNSMDNHENTPDFENKLIHNK